MRMWCGPFQTVVNRLSYPRKLVLFAVIFLIPLATGVVYLLRDSHADYVAAETERLKLAYSVGLQGLHRQIAQHRGMLNGYLNGEHAFQDKLRQRQDEIGHNLARLAAAHDPFLRTWGLAEKWAGIVDHWRIILEKLSRDELTPQTAFADHTNLIAEIIQQIEDNSPLAELKASQESEVNYQGIGVLVSELAWLEEYSGRLRGLGTGMAARRESQANEQRELIELYGFVQARLEGVRNHIMAEYPGQVPLQRELQRSIEHTRDFLAVVNTELIGRPTINIAPAVFFDLATLAIDADFVLSDTTAQQLELILARRIETLKTRMLFFALFVAGGVLAVVTLFRALYCSIIGSVNCLQDAALSIAAGNLEHKVELESRDEMALIGKAFNEMTAKLRENITLLQNNEQQLVHQLLTDTLTGQPNRVQLQRDVLARPESALFLINIDSFQEYNDAYGTEVGDQILVALGRSLVDLLPDERVSLYKLAADEFAVLFRQWQVEEVKEFGELIYQHVTRQVFRIREIDLRISVTLGCAVPGETEAEDLLAAADIALKVAKQRRLPILYSWDVVHVRAQYEENIRWAKFVKEAIEEDRVVPFFQPIINNRTAAVEKYECLVRIMDEQGKVVTPYYFLNIAKQARLYPQLTRIVVEKSFAAFRDTDYEFSINLSVEDILDPETEAFLVGRLTDSALARRLTFEIVESEGIEKCTEMTAFIQRVKGLGCKIAVDDFGTGYSNFEYILELDVDYLKIDGSMIKNILTDKNSQAITATIVTFAGKVGLQTVAEFVHCQEVYELVKRLGVDYSQGYYLGEPKPSLE